MLTLVMILATQAILTVARRRGQNYSSLFSNYLVNFHRSFQWDKRFVNVINFITQSTDVLTWNKKVFGTCVYFLNICKKVTGILHTYFLLLYRLVCQLLHHRDPFRVPFQNNSRQHWHPKDSYGPTEWRKQFCSYTASSDYLSSRALSDFLVANVL